MAAKSIQLTFFNRASSVLYLADVALDATGAEIIEWLLAVDDEGPFLEQLHPSERYELWLARTGTSIDDGLTLAAAGARDGDEVIIGRMAHGAGAVDLAAGLAAAKLSIDAAQVGVDAYRARTERMAADLERERLEDERGQRKSTANGEGEPGAS